MTVERGSQRYFLNLLFLISAILVLLLAYTSSQAAAMTWSKTYGGTDFDGAGPVQQTADGGYIVAGTTYSFGAGNADLWILKLNSSGTVAWQKTYGGANDDYSSSIQQTTDGGYIVAGATHSFGAGIWDFWVLKLNSDGTVAWQKTYGGAVNDWADSIQQTADGGYIVAGRTGRDLWILKLNSDGTVAWQKTYGGAGDDQVSSVRQTADGGYIAAGQTSSFGAGSGDFWILKLDSDGVAAWQKTYGGADYDGANSIQQTADGGYIVAGQTYSFGAGDADSWILKLNSGGAVTWQKTYGGANNDNDDVKSIQQTSDGGYITAGYTYSVSGFSDFWILKLSSDGVVTWQKTYGGADDEQAYSIQQTPDSGFIVAGETYSSFGAGGSDAWILKLDANGDITGCPGGLIGTSNAIVAATSVADIGTAATVINTGVTDVNSNAAITDTSIVHGEVCSPAGGGGIELPRTGQTKCYDQYGTEIACSGTGQDGDIRAGVAWPDPRFTVGNGAEADCITDNLTGLMWPRNGNLMNGLMNWNIAIDSANDLTWCGHSDWRLPNINELGSLVNADVQDTALWLNTQGFYNMQDYYYWSSTTYDNVTGYAWVAYMVHGGAAYDDKGNGLYALPVRSGQSGELVYSAIQKTGQTVSYRPGDDGDLEIGTAWPDTRFIDNGDGTVKDNLTGLVWLKNANCINTDYPFFDNNGTSGDGKVEWQHALDFVRLINIGIFSQCGAGHTDWRLPNRNELRSLIDYSRYGHALSAGHPFTSVQSEFYWLSTTFAYDTYYSWFVGMLEGYVSVHNKGNFNYVWPVRTGQVGVSFNYYCDNDSDGHIDTQVDGTCTGSGCVPAGCQTTAGDDCNDSDGSINPGLSESMKNGRDDDCNSATPDTVPALWTGNGHYYQMIVVPGGITWDNARTAAESLTYAGVNGHLVTITSGAENAFITDDPVLGEGNVNVIAGLLIGGFQPAGSPEPDGGWSWVTGEAFTYSNWWYTEPNDSGSEDKMQFAGGLRSDGQVWNDISGWSSQPGYMVEFDTDSDGDGLTDSWEMLYFGSLDQGPNDDPDNDGRSNLEEMNSDSDPLVSNLDDGLVAYYPFNGNANDESGTGNDGTVIGALLTTDRFSNINSAYMFNGVDSYIDAGNSSSLDPSLTDRITVMAWMKFNNTHSEAIIGKWGGNQTVSYLLYKMQDSNYLRWGTDPNDVATNSNFPLVPDQWYHVVGVADSDSARLYIDGVLAGTSTNGVSSINSSPVNVRIGYEDSAPSPFSGSIDEVRIYNRALSDGEIGKLFESDSDGDGLTDSWEILHFGNLDQAANDDPDNDGRSNLEEMNSGSDPLVSNLDDSLVAYYPFNGNANDESGNGNHGTVHGAVLTADRFGNVESAYDIEENYGLNGSGNFIEIPNMIHDHPKLSISMWVKENNMSEASGDAYLSVGYDGASGNYIFIGHIGNELRFSAYSSIAYLPSTLSVPFQNEWIGNFQHYVLIADGLNGIMRGYRNGVLLGTREIPAGIISVAFNQAGLGKHWWDNGNQSSTRFNGSIDDVRIYNRALSDGEIEKLFESDSDSDGLTDTWEILYFGNLSQGPNDDPDNDGRSNLEEMNSGSDPLVSNLDDGLIAYYPFNGNANDESGNGNDGTVNGATLTTDRGGYADSAYDFNDTNDYIVVQDSPTLELTTAYTLNVWIKGNAYSGTIVAKGASANYYPDYQIGVQQHLSTQASVVEGWYEGENDNSSSPRIDGNHAFDNNSWHMVSIVFTGNEKITTYLDGVFDNEATVSIDQVRTSNRELFIGAWRPGYSFISLIDDTRIYNRALSAGEIEKLYSEQAGESIDYYCDSDSDGHIDTKADGTCTGSGCAPSGCQTTAGDDFDDNDATMYPGAPELCDGRDNDNNGQTDENLIRPTACGMGACTGNQGLETCSAGTWGNDTCNPFGGATSESCNDIDDDCDGATDEDLTRPTSCGVGVCTGNTGMETCSAGTWGSDTCNPLEGATLETCNDVDDDCDGATDEDLTRPTTCGVGECGSSGTETCTAGSWVDACTPGTPQTEVCDGLDNNCDGDIDEVCPADIPDANLKAAIEQALGKSNPAISDMLALTSLSAGNRGISDLTGIEYAENLGVLDLTANRISDIAPLSGLASLQELSLAWNCINDFTPVSHVASVNGTDDQNADSDLDGICDDYDTCVDADGDGYGIGPDLSGCAGSTTVPDLNDNDDTIHAGAPELCDNRDNDGDGQTDENLSRLKMCGVGICATTGTVETCAAGEWTGGACTPGTPMTEGPIGTATCSDALDNDCDGAVDGIDSDCITWNEGNPQWTRQMGTSEHDYAQSVAVDTGGNVYVTGSTIGDLDGNTNGGEGTFDLFLVKYNSAGLKLWTRQMGTGSSDYSTGVAVDVSGNVYVTGYTDGGLDGNINAGGDDLFLVKYNSDGVKQWTRQMGTSTGDYASGVAADSSGNAYVTGYTGGGLDGNVTAGGDDLFLVKYSGSGTKLWTRQMGTSAGDHASGVAADSGGNVYVTGYTGGGLDGNVTAGGDDLFLVKYSGSGTKLWTRQMGTSAGDYAAGVAADSGGNVYVTGYTFGGLDGNINAGGDDLFLVKYTSAGVKQWTKQMGTSFSDNASSVGVDDGGNIYVTGVTNGILEGNWYEGGRDVFLIKFSGGGVKRWTRHIGTSSDDSANAVAVDVSGNVYVTGSTDGGLDGNTNAGGYDFFLVKYDGMREWTRQMGTSGSEVASGVAVDGSGNVYVAGNTNGADAFLVKYISSGLKQWTMQIGTGTTYGVTVAGNGDIYVTGYTYGGLDGNTNEGGADLFLMKFNSAGMKLWTRQMGTSGNDYAAGVAADSIGNVYAAGSTDGAFDGYTNASGYKDLFLVKYDSAGVKLWTRQMGTLQDDYADGVAVDGSDNVYVTGSTDGGLDGNTSAGSYDFFLVKYNSSGVKQWTRQMGGANFNDSDYASGVAVDGSGNVYVTGSTTGGLDGNTHAGYPGQYRDLFLVKYDSSGVKQWTKQMGTDIDDYATGVAVDVSGNAFVTGYTGGGLDGNTSAGGNDIFLVTYSSAGVKLRTNQMGTSGNDYADGVAVTLGGDLYIAGSSNASFDGNFYQGGSDIVLLKYSISQDTTLPTGSVLINAGAAVINSSSIFMALACTDPVGCKEMRFSNDNINWSASEAYATSRANWDMTASLYGGTSGDGIKTVYVKFMDNTGNWSVAYSDDIAFDTTIPTGSVTINSDNAYANSNVVTLTISADDLNGISEMRFSNDNTSWSVPETFNATWAWLLSSVDGTKAVYAKVRDNAGNWSDAFSDTITLDNTAPITTATPPGGTGIGEAKSVSLICGDGTGSGCDRTYYCHGEGCTPMILYSAPIPVNTDTTLRYYSTDNLGSTETVKTQAYSFIAGYTELTLELSTPTIDQGGSVMAWGRLHNMNSNGADPTGETITLHMIDPNGVPLTPVTTQISNNLGDFLFNGVSGFTLKGAYTLYVSFGGTGLLAAADSQSLPLLVGASAGYAIIIEGKIKPSPDPYPNGEPSHNKTANRIYQRLKTRGFADDNIYYFNYLTQAGVDGKPLKAVIQYAVEEWALPRMNGMPAPLYIIMVDHGSEDAFHIDSGNANTNEDNDTISPTDLNTWLTTLESGLSAEALVEKRVVIIGACYSGSFIDELSQAPAEGNSGRVIVTSSAEDEVSYKGPMEGDNIRSGEFFLEELFTRLERGYTFRDAFEEATESTEMFTRRGGAEANAAAPYYDGAVQHPMLDDNGDAQGSNVLGDGTEDDGTESEGLVLGVGVEYNQNSAATPADITEVSRALYLDSETTSAILWARVNHDNEVDVAPWIEIRTPSMVLNPQAGSNQQELTLTKIPLSLNQGVWEKDPSVATPPVPFTESGKYEVYYFVRDKDTKKLSPMKRSLVYKDSTENLAPPGAFDLTSPIDGSVQEMKVILDWEESVDPDGDEVTYTVMVSKHIPGVPAEDNPFDTVDYIREGITTTWALVGEDGELSDLTHYDWKVVAVDPYGKHTESSQVWSFSTDDDNGTEFPGIITGYVYVSGTNPKVPIASATITTSNGRSTTSAANGFYSISNHTAGTWSISVSRAGYNPDPESSSVTVISLKSTPKDLSMVLQCIPVTEVCDGVDNDCDGLVDDNDPGTVGQSTWHPDADSDTYGNASVSLSRCIQPVGYVSDNTDCNDSDQYIYPNGPEVRIVDAPMSYYWIYELQTAYNDAQNLETIQGKFRTYTGNLAINQNKTVIIEGGYTGANSCGFTSMTGRTTVRGNVTISNGTVKILNGTLEVQQ